jgi:hypothetical protein
VSRALRHTNLLILTIGLVAGCQYFEDSGDGTTTLSRTEGFTAFAHPGQIDDNAGTYRGVGIGDPIRAIKRVFGVQRPAGDYEPGTPFRYPEGGYDGPWVMTFGDYDPFGPTLRYYDVVFTFKGRQGLGAFQVVEPGATTGRGVGIGDPLESVERAYPELRCGTVNEDTEYEEYAACTGKLGPSRFIWFGGDPIKSITMSTNSLGGVTEDEPFAGQVFELEDGQFVTFPAGEAKAGDKIVCAIAGKRIEVFVPRRGGVSDDPVYVEMRPDGSVRAECGGVHAETAPPGSW